MRLKLVPTLRQPAPRGTTPVAVSDGGVLVVEEGGSIDSDEAAIELVNPKDSLQALPELNPDIANHWYVVGPSGSGKSSITNVLLVLFHWGPSD